MKLGLFIWTICIFGAYAFCVVQEIEVFLILWILLALLGLVFFIADHATAQTIEAKKSRIIGTSEEDIHHQIEN